jgi:Uma2 family endonuclease
MSTLTIDAPVTPEDLLKIPDAVNYELVGGKLVERKMGMESSEIAVRIIGLIMLFLRDNPMGHLYGADASYQCFVDAPGKVRKPDASFIRSGRLAGERSPKGHCPIPPDLAVEVISPGDLAYEVDEKVAEYLAAGVPLVWVVSPPTRRVRVYRSHASPHGSVAELTVGDMIGGDDVLPGFSCPVAKFFE